MGNYAYAHLCYGREVIESPFGEDKKWEDQFDFEMSLRDEGIDIPINFIAYGGSD